MRLRSQSVQPNKDFKFIANIAEALGHPIRVEIVKYVAAKNTVRNDVCNGELVVNLPVAQATVSQHVKKLVKAEILKVRKENGFSFYSLNQKVLENFIGEIRALLESEVKDNGKQK